RLLDASIGSAAIACLLILQHTQDLDLDRRRSRGCFGALPHVGRHRRLFIILAFNSLQDGAETPSGEWVCAVSAVSAVGNAAGGGCRSVGGSRSCDTAIGVR